MAFCGGKKSKEKANKGLPNVPYDLSGKEVRH
jgi:hypothetical protein